MLAALAAGVIAPLGVAAPAAAADISPFDAVNQFIGTQLDTTQNKSNDAYGNTYPGAALPFGMVQPSPTTYKTGETNSLVQEKGGYEYTADKIRGFGMTRYSGTGCHQRFGGYEFPTIPYAGAMSDGVLPASPDSDLGRYFLPFSHDDEVSQPGYYEVTTENGVTTKLTATKRTAVSEFDFSAADGSTLILNVSGANNRVHAADVTIDPETRTVSGSMFGADVCDNGNVYRAFFSTTYDQAFESHGTWNGAALTAGSDAVSKGGTDTNTDFRSDIGAWLTFADGAIVTAKTGFSYTSVEAAAANAEAETADKSFADVRADARAAWEEALGTVEVEGGTTDERVKLYTALYHALLQPTIGHDVDGTYLGYDGELHTIEEGHDFFRRINFAGQGWDMYRSQAQLIAMLFPDVAVDINRSIVILTEQMKQWSPGAARMSGDNYQVILSTLDAFGATDYDRQAALDSMIATQLLPVAKSTRSEAFQYSAAGWIENRKQDNATSRTLEYAVDDFAIAQLAQRLGDTATYDTFMVRAQNWQNVFDPTTLNIRPRERTGFDRGFDLRNRDQATNGGQFNQSTGYQYGWMVPHNIGELVERRGGIAASTRALDVLMERLDAGAYTQTGNYLSNEAALTTPWVYNWLRAPHKTTDVLYRAVTEMYTTTPKGLPGNDDEGALSAWYVFATIGVAPMIHGTANLLVTAPMFDKVTLTSLGSDRVYEINAPGVSDGKRYTVGIEVDGVAQTASYVGEDFGRDGGVLDFTMSATPGSWGTAADDVPPSYNDGIDAMNNVGTSPNGVKWMASMDFSNWSFSRETLAGIGLAPGASVEYPNTGIEFTWPDTQPGEPDNWVPNGQRVELPEQNAASISFLGLATNGPSSGTAVVEYTDGSTQNVAVSFTDWNGSANNGNVALKSVVGRNNGDGGVDTGGTFRVWATRPAPLDATKTVAAVRLPVASYSGVMHIFDVATSTQEYVDPNAPDGTPERIVLTSTVDPSTSQYVTWRSRSPLSLTPSIDVRLPGGDARTVAAVQMPERSVDGYPARSQSAKLTGLTPDTVYEYRVTSGTKSSEWMSFRTAKASTEPFQFLYFGDAQNGIDTVWPGTLQAAHAAVPDARLSLFAGDLIDVATSETEWRNWFNAVGTHGKATSSQMLAAMGNHEIGGDAFAPVFRDSFEYDPDGPIPSDAGAFEKTYGEHMASVMKDSVYFTDYQGVRFVTMNANRDDICPLITPPGLTTFNCDEGRRVWMQMQATWLDRVLKDNPNQWAVMLTHQPIFSVSEGRNEDNWRRYIGPVLERHNIDLVLQGHDHTYGRGFHTQNATDEDGISTGPVYVVANAGEKQYSLQGDPNVWTQNGAKLVKSYADTTTYQAISVDGDTLTYKSVATWARAGGKSPFEPGDTVDEFTITKYGDGTKWVTEAGVAAPADGAPSKNRALPVLDDTFDPEQFGAVVWDDDFDENSLADYRITAGNGEPLPNVSVNTAQGVLQGVATGRSWAHISLPVSGLENWALIVEPERFTGSGASEDSMFLGARADNRNMLLSWYNNTRRGSGFDFQNDGAGKQLGLGDASVRWDRGDRMAVVADHGEFSSWIEEDGTWRRTNIGMSGYGVTAEELATWAPTVSMRMDPGTIAIDRVTLIEGGLRVVEPVAPSFRDEWGTASDAVVVQAQDGVEYRIGDAVLDVGATPATGAVTVTAHALAGYRFAEGATTEWTHVFSDAEEPVDPEIVTPRAPIFRDDWGTDADAIVIEAQDGVEYRSDDAVLAVGATPATGSVTVTAHALEGYELAAGAVAEWTHVFSDAEEPVDPTVVAVSGRGTSYGTQSQITATIRAEGESVSGGMAKVYVDGDYYRTVPVADGRITAKLAYTLAAGRHTVSVHYSGTVGVQPGKSYTKLTVTKATSTATLSVNRTKVSTKATNLVATVRVSIPGSTVKPTGNVRVQIGGKTYTKALSGGVVTVAIPRSALSTPNTKTVKATYLGNGNVASDAAPSKKVTVVRG